MSRYDGIDWRSFVQDGLVITLVCAIVSIPLIAPVQAVVYALHFVDVVTYMKVFWVVLAIALTGWLIAIKTYKHWFHKMKRR